MALVVLLRGVNVGGRRNFRPTELVKQLEHLDAVNIGAAGTFVIRRRIGRKKLRDEVAAGLPFDAEIVICEGREILALMSRNPFAELPVRGEIVRFLTVLSRAPRATPPTPVQFPVDGRWLVKVIGREGRFVFGMYRRHMKTIGHLGKVDSLFGVPATTRNWNTVTAIARALRHEAG